MNEMTDNHLDTLIRETMERRQLLADLDRLVITDIRRQVRRAWMRRWARIVVFSFGLPLVLLVFFTCTCFYIKERGTSAFTLVILSLPTLALIYSTHRALNTFSPEEV